jgi:prepilin-type N-terminal cleavage/methylation domain-containing protein
MSTSRLRQSAFSLVELLIAVSILAVVGSISIPSFNKFNRQQDRNRSANVLADCIRKARNLAVTRPTGFGKFIPTQVSSEGRLRYTAALLRNTGNDITCEVYWFTGRVTAAEIGGNAAPVSELGRAYSPVTVANTQFVIAAVATTSTTLPGQYLLLTFDGARAGEPVSVRGCASSDGTGTCIHTENTKGTGIEASLIFSQTDGTASITIPADTGPIVTVLL